MSGVSTDHDQGDPDEGRQSTRDVGRNVGTFALGQVAIRLIGLAVVPLVARLFSTEDFGRYAVAVALSGMLSTPVESGMGGYLVREGTQKPAHLNVLLGHAISLQTGMGVAAIGLSALIAFLLGYDRETYITTIVSTVAAVVFIINRSQMAVLISLKRVREHVTFYSVQALVLAILTISVALLGWGPVGIAMGYLAASAISLPAGQMLLRRYWKLRVTFQREGLKTTFSGSVAFSASKLGNALLTYIDAVMVQAMRGNSEAAAYGVAYRFYAAMRLVPTVYADSLSQPVARLARTDKEALADLFNRSASQLFVMAVPLAVGGFLLGEELVTTIFGSKYAGATTAATLLLLTLVVSFPRTAVIVTALAVGLERRIVIAYVITVLVNVVANALLIPAHGAVGAAAAMVISIPVFGFFMAFQLTHAGVALRIDVRYGKAVLAGAVMSVAVLVTASLPLPVPILTGAAIYLAALIALNTFDYGDLEMLPGGKRLTWLVRAPHQSREG